MKRSEVIAQYDVDADGFITSPGKFEGDRLYAPHYYEAYLNGCASYDDEDGEILVFDILEDERKEFPELGDALQVLMYVCEQGFVSCTLTYAPPVK